MMPQSYSDAFYAFAEEHELDILEPWPQELEDEWAEKAKVLLHGVVSHPIPKERSRADGS